MRVLGSLGKYTTTCSHTVKLADIFDRYAMTGTEKDSWIDAVKCLQGITALTPTSFAPGARHRIDDLAVAHIKHTLVQHFNVSDKALCITSQQP
jgi:hypothetical protein